MKAPTNNLGILTHLSAALLEYCRSIPQGQCGYLRTSKRGYTSKRRFNSGGRYKVFISHASKDATVAQLFCSYLVEAYDIKEEEIFCTSKIRNGLQNDAYFFPIIQKALQQSSVIIFLYSGKFMASKDCLMELGMGYFSRDKRRCLFLIGDATQKDIPGMLAGLQNLGSIEMPGALSVMEGVISPIIRSKREEIKNWEELGVDFVKKARPHIIASQQSVDLHSSINDEPSQTPQTSSASDGDVTDGNEALASPQNKWSAVNMMVDFRRFLIKSDPDLYFIQHYSMSADIKEFLGKLAKYQSRDLWLVWGDSYTAHFYTDKIDDSELPYVQFGENRFKIAELWLVCDRSCSQCDGDFILIRYESYECPNGVEIEYWYKGKQISEVQALNGLVKNEDGSVEYISPELYREINHNNEGGIMLIAPRLSCFAEAIDRAPIEANQILQALTEGNKRISDADIAALCGFFRRFHNSDVMATA